MMRLAVIAVFASTVGCVAEEQELSTTEAAVSTPAPIPVCDTHGDVQYTCITPIPWTSSLYRVQDFWENAGPSGTNENAPNAMIHVEMLGATYCPGTFCTAVYYCFLVSGGAQNKLWRVYAINGSDIDQFNITMRNAYNIREAYFPDNRDGGTGGTGTNTGGTTGGPYIGPHGFPMLAVQNVQNIATMIRTEMLNPVTGLAGNVRSAAGY